MFSYSFHSCGKYPNDKSLNSYHKNILIYNNNNNNNSINNNNNNNNINF